MRPGADLTAAGVGHLVAGFLDALDLSDVTLVGNDSGAGHRPEAHATARPAQNDPFGRGSDGQTDDQVADHIGGYRTRAPGLRSRCVT